MPRVLARSAAAFAAVVLATSAAADLVTVGPGDSLQAAVDAAAPGDVLRVLPGDYADPGSLVIDKPLVLLGAGSAATSYTPLLVGLTGEVPLRVEGLAAGEEVRVIGLELRQLAWLGTQLTTLARVDGCAGPVVLADVAGDSFGAFGVTPPLGAVVVRDSAQVTLDGCAFTAGGGALDDVLKPGIPCLYVEGSTVSVNGSSLVGGRGEPTFPYGIGAAGGPGIRALGSLVRVGRSSVTGGSGVTGTTAALEPGTAGAGGTGLVATGSTVHVRGGPGNALSGGAGSLGQDVGAGGAAASLDASSTLTTTPDCALSSGADGNGAVTGPVLAPDSAGTWTQLAERLATMTLDPVVATVGGPSTTSFAGEPFGVGVTGFSVGQAPAFEVPPIAGPIVLDLTGFGTYATLALDAGGAAALTSTLPSQPSLVGATVMLQGVVASPGGALSVSPPACQGFVD